MNLKKHIFPLLLSVMTLEHPHPSLRGRIRFDSRDQPPKEPKGNLYKFPDGFTCRALNQKNANRKHTNHIKKITNSMTLLQERYDTFIYHYPHINHSRELQERFNHYFQSYDTITGLDLDIFYSHLFSQSLTEVQE